jgi:site-specific recombinase XerD
MNEALTTIQAAPLAPAVRHIDQALEAAESPHTRRAYERSLKMLAEWLGNRELNYAVLREYRAHLIAHGHSAQTINSHMAGIRFYAREMAKAGHITVEQSQSLQAIENVKIKGRKLGNWLSVEDATKILNQPDTSTPAGLRDRAILGLLLGAGLRRSEVVGLEMSHFEKRDGRWMLIGVKGKHGRTRNIPIPDWVKALVDQWTERAEIKSGIVVRPVSWSKKKFWIRDERMDTSSLFQIVKKYGKNIGRFQIAPHDLRRTFARLAYEGNAPIKQIQLALGHANQSTTETYVNAQQDLQIAPGDVLGIEI